MFCSMFGSIFFHSQARSRFVRNRPAVRLIAIRFQRTTLGWNKKEEANRPFLFKAARRRGVLIKLVHDGHFITLRAVRLLCTHKKSGSTA